MKSKRPLASLWGIRVGAAGVAVGASPALSWAARPSGVKLVDDAVTEAYLRSASPWVAGVRRKVPAAGMSSGATRSSAGSCAGGVGG